MNFTYYLLLLLGLLMVATLHLAIPIFFAIRKITFSKKSLIGLAFIGAGVGFLICALLVENFRGPVGVLQSGFWGMISYIILRKNCSEKPEEQEEREEKGDTDNEH